MKKLIFKIVLLSACLSLCLVTAALSQQYTYTALPYIGQGYWSNEGDAWVSEINDRGQVTGTTREIDGQFYVRAFLWSEDKGLLLVENIPIGDGLTRGYALNNLGQVVGYGISSAPSKTTPLIWSEMRGTNFLNLPSGYEGGADSVNNKGEITGVIWQGFSEPTSFVIWENAEAEPIILDKEPFDYISFISISQNGTIVGQGYDDSNSPTAFKWTKKEGTQMLDPPYLPGDDQSGAYDVSGSGAAIVGYSHLETLWNKYNAVLWSKGTIEELGNLGGRTANVAYGVNNSKTVVGVSFDYVEESPGTWIPGNGRAFVWNNNKQIMDLNDLVVDLPDGVELFVAVDVNNKGQIVVEGLNSTGKTVFAVLTPLTTPLLAQ
jgi:uncharacterized membrane protein